MSTIISADTWFNITKLFQSAKISCSSTNNDVICTKNDPKTGEPVDLDTALSTQFSPKTAKNLLGSQIISASLNALNRSQASILLDPADDISRSNELQTTSAEERTSGLVILVLAEKGIGLNINISV